MNNNTLIRYILLARRWMWMIVLGITICSGTTYIAALLMRPTYQATTDLLLAVGTSQSTYDNASASLELQSTYSQLITRPQVLAPVASKYHLTLEQLQGMVTVKPQSNSQLIEVDVTYSDPQQATEIVNDIAQSLAQFSVTKLNGVVQITILTALEPTIPIRPKPTTDALLGALVGLGLALSLIIVFEWIDDRIESPEEVQQKLGLDVLTSIPVLAPHQRMKKAEEIPALAEGCNMLCAALNTRRRHKPFKLIMVTSALAGEGKSTIAANLASFLAQSGKRVLLVDADLRHSMLDQHFQVDNHRGLSNTLLEMWAQVEVKLDGQPTEIPSLRILTAGIQPANPAEMLQSPLAQQLFQHFREAQEFDYIIFDTPPALPVADAQILASYIDTTILVADISKTSHKLLARVIHTLRKAGTNVLGTVVNKSQWPENGAIHDYLNNLQQERSRATLVAPLPEEMTRRFNTSRANGKVADDTTMRILAQRQPQEGE